MPTESKDQASSPKSISEDCIPPGLSLLEVADLENPFSSTQIEIIDIMLDPPPKRRDQKSKRKIQESVSALRCFKETGFESYKEDKKKKDFFGGLDPEKQLRNIERRIRNHEELREEMNKFMGEDGLSLRALKVNMGLIRKFSAQSSQWLTKSLNFLEKNLKVLEKISKESHLTKPKKKKILKVITYAKMERENLSSKIDILKDIFKKEMKTPQEQIASLAE